MERRDRLAARMSTDAFFHAGAIERLALSDPEPRRETRLRLGA